MSKEPTFFSYVVWPILRILIALYIGTLIGSVHSMGWIAKTGQWVYCHPSVLGIYCDLPGVSR